MIGGAANHRALPLREPLAITFDCWGTLLVESRRDETHRRRVACVEVVAAECDRNAPPQAARTALDGAWRRHWDCWNAGTSSTPLDIARWTLSALEIDATGAAERLADALDAVVGEADVEALPGAVATLMALSERGLPLGLVCDTGFTGGRGVRRLLDAKGLGAWLTFQSYSDEAGVPKPHPRIFTRALGALGVAPGGAIHVGDLRRTDVAGGRSLGMATVRISEAHDDTSDRADADVVVDSYRALRAQLGVTVTGLGVT